MNALEALAEALLVGLVTFRLWRLAALDTIANRPRAWLYRRCNGDGAGWDAVVYWLGCPWCSGFWLAGAVTATVETAAGWSWWALAVWWASAAVVPMAATLTADAGNDA